MPRAIRGFLLDCADGSIYARLLGDEELCGRRVASDFERFFRALAGINIARLSKNVVPCAEEIAKFVQADEIRRLSFGEKWLEFDKFNHRRLLRQIWLISKALSATISAIKF